MKSMHLLKRWTLLSVALTLMLCLLGGGQPAPGQGPQFPDEPSRSGHHPVDGGSPGPYPVGHTSFVSTMDSGRPVAINVWYPADARRITHISREAVYVMDPYTHVVGSTTSSQWESMGYDRAYETPVAAQGPFPLVMFSPGYCCNGWNYLYFGTRLASHGYIVAVMEHFGDGYWLPVEPPNFDIMANIIYNRPRDVSFALTEVLRKNNSRGDVLHGAIDRRHIVAAGHSFGGYAALTELAGDDQVCDTMEVTWFGEEVPAEDCVPTPPDRRFTALLTLDGSSHMLHWEELSRIRVPSLIMGDASQADGDNAEGLSFESFVARPHAAVSDHTRSVRVDIDEIEHASFGNPSNGYWLLLNAGMWSQEDYDFYCAAWGFEDVRDDSEAQRIITKYAVAWLNAEVAKDESKMSQDILTQAYAMRHEPAVELWWDERCPRQGRVQPGTFKYFYGMERDEWTVGDKNPVDFFIPCP